MRHAPWLLAAALWAGCETRIMPKGELEPRAYRCTGDAGLKDECPSKWVCNATWGHCFNPTQGDPVPCSVDSECGGGWRCTSTGVCADPAREGTLTTATNLDAGATLLHPVAMRGRAMPPLVSAELASSPPGRASSVAWTDGGEWQWLLVDARDTPEGRTLTHRFFEGTASMKIRSLVPSTWQQPGVPRPQHTLWVLDEAGGVARYDDRADGGLVPTASVPKGFSKLALVPGSNLSSPSAQFGVVVGWLGGGGGTTTLAFSRGAPDAGWSNVENTVNAAELAWLTCNGPQVVTLSNANVSMWPFDEVLANGFAATDAGWSVPSRGVPLGVRVASLQSKLYLAWLEATEPPTLHTLDVTTCTTPVALSPVVSPCKGLKLRNYGLAVQGGVVQPVFECHTRDDVEGTTELYVGQQVAPARYLAARLSTAAQPTFSLYADGLLTWGDDLLTEQDLTLPAPPDLLEELEDGGLRVVTRDGVFEAMPSGVRLVQARGWQSLPVAVLPEAGFRVRRDGTLEDLDPPHELAASPEEAWANPKAFVNAVALPFRDAGVVVVTHDDALDVVDLNDDSPVLSTRLRPSPNVPITSLALRAPPDGGLAEGVLIAGLDGFDVRASSARRWTATRLDLSGLRPMYAWFDPQEMGTERLRVLLEDGTIVGSTRVRLSPPLPDNADVRAAVDVAGAPYVLSADTLYGLEATSDGVAWTEIDLPPPAGFTADDLDFSQGRLLVGEDALYVFSSDGMVWSLPR